MGTMLQERGLEAGASPEALNLDKPEIVRSVHADYAAAGAQVIVSNSFGGSRSKLSHYGLEDKVHDINARAVTIAQEAVADYPEAMVAACLGPTGRFAQPVGDAPFAELVEIFGEQVKAFAETGPDLITCETFLDLRELKAAVVAAKTYAPHLPLIAMMTFEEGGRSVLGTPPEAAAVTLAGLGADVVGANCGLGIEGIYELLCKMRQVTHVPLIAQSNAGLPQLRDGVTVFPATPEDMVTYHDRLIELGVRVIGGCCGTTPDHIQAMRQALEGKDMSWQAPPAQGYLSSRSAVTPVGVNKPCAIIGERINPTGKKGYSAELREGKTAYIRRQAKDQSEVGAHLLDINVGAPGVDEPAAMEKAVFAVNGICNTPVVLDSSDPEALERGLQAADGRVLINSVNGEDKSLDAILPLARKYGAAVIGLTLDENGIPKTADGRVAIARKILDRAQTFGLGPQDVIIDCLTLTVSAEQQQAVITLETLRRVRDELNLATVLGVSNISYGLPCRPKLSSTFFTMALQAGLGAAIINPMEEEMMAAYRSSMVLLGHDPNAAAYIDAYSGQGGQQKEAQQAEKPQDMRSRLTQAIVEGDKDGVVPLVEEALQELEALQISNEGLLPGLEIMGKRFGKGEVFLPQVIQSADTMHAAFDRLKAEMAGERGEPVARILMATVEGDIHDIGKNIVITLLENHNFEVIDLGKNVSAAKIVEEAKRLQVDAVGLSALMTTTLEKMGETLEELRAAGVKVLTMVGGAVVTPEYAEEIQADLYAKDALEAVEKAKQLFAA